MKTTQNALIRAALYMGIVVPVCYFGIQLIAAPFFRGYSFVDQPASLLGSDLSTFPILFNLGAMLTGVIAVIASFGFAGALQQLKAHRLFVWLSFILLLSVGLGNLWAGIFPMPSPRHGTNPFGIAFFLLPFLLPIVLWKFSSRPIKIYFLLNILFFGLLALSKSRVITIDLFNHEGIFQRTLAFIAFVPIAVSAYALLQKNYAEI
jgi:hypothetical membrane protein